MTTKALAHGLKVTEVPITYLRRHGKPTKLGLSETAHSYSEHWFQKYSTNETSTRHSFSHAFSKPSKKQEYELFRTPRQAY